MVARLRSFGVVAASILGSAVLVHSAAAQSTQTPPPPRPSANGAPDSDLGCRKQAAAETGYNSSNASPDTERRYADAYYTCMDQAYGPPGLPSGSAYGPPSPYYYYPPYPYAYPYYGPYYYPPYYYGPGIDFRFGFHRR
jgi:hypothetical protein